MTDTIEETPVTADTTDAAEGFDPEAAFEEGQAAASETEPATGATEDDAVASPAQSTAESTDVTEAEEEDPWAAALAEQEASEPDTTTEPGPAHAAATAVAGSDQVFRPLGQETGPATTRELDIIMNIPVKLNVELGRTKISIKQLLELTQGSVLELDGLAGDPMDILINGYLIAQGEVVVVEDKYGIRITDIITPSERVEKLNR